MPTIRADIAQFRKQLRAGSLQKSYRVILGYMTDLRTQFKEMYPNYSVSGLYQGYLDMSYFALVPPSFQRRRLKIAIVFNYRAFRFEAWLSGVNRQALQKYWGLVKDARWPGYRLVPPGTWADSIVECDLVSNPDFANPRPLTARIEKKVAKFTNDMERFLSRR
jgi:hypothetical protein